MVPAAAPRASARRIIPPIVLLTRVDPANPGLTPSFRRSLPETGCLSQGLPHGTRRAAIVPNTAVHAEITSHWTAHAPCGAGTRACRVATHRDACRAHSKARPEESGHRRLRVCATSSLRSYSCAVPKHPGIYGRAVAVTGRPRVKA